MQVINEKPLIFIDNPYVDEISVEYRRVNKLLNDAMKLSHSSFITLQDIIDKDSAITRGVDQPGPDVPEGVPLVQVENMNLDRSINIEALGTTSKEISNRYKRTILKTGDIIVSIRATIGRVVEVPKELEGANITRGSALIRLSDKSMNEFLMLYLESDLGQLQMTLNTRGAAIRSINLSDLREIKIPETDDNTQKTIIKRYIKILSLSEDIISNSKKFMDVRNKVHDKLNKILTNDSDNKKRNNKKSENLWDWGNCLDNNCAISTINEQCAIVRNLNQDRLDSRYSLPQRLRKVVAEKPNEWCCLSDHASVERTTYNSDATLEHIAIDKMPNDPWQQFDVSEGYVGSTILLEKGDIAISRLMPTIMNGKCFMAWKKMTGSAEFIRVRIDKNYQKIIFFWLKSEIVRKFLLANVRGSSASQKRFTEDDLKNLPIPKDIIDYPEEYLSKCEKALSEALDFEKKSHVLKEKSENILRKAKSNIFSLLDDDWFNALVNEAKEVLK